MRKVIQLGLISCLIVVAWSRGQQQQAAKKIAIGDVGLQREQNSAATDLIIAELANEQRAEFLERQNLETLLREAQLSLSGRIAPDQAVRLGQAINVDWFILGTRSAVTNSEAIFLKLVEARTGVIRDVRPIPIQRQIDLPKFVTESSAFIRDNLAASNAPTRRRFVTIGSFEDLSVGGRLRTLPTQIRNYLLNAYQGSEVQLLERDQVRWLTDELRLSLGGISQNGNSTGSSFTSLWTIDGKYQYVQSNELTAEMVLVVQRIGATPQERRITAKIGEPLFAGIKAVLDQAMSGARVARGTRSEIDLLLNRAKELTGLSVRTNENKRYLTSAARVGVAQTHDREKQLANAKEAVKALDSVLLLDPENFEARMFAAYIIDSFDGREQARNYAQEALARAPDGRWADIARGIIAHTYLMSREAGAAEYLEKLEANTADEAIQSEIVSVRETVVELAVREGRMPREKLAPVTEQALSRFLKGHYEHSLKTGEPMYVDYNGLLHLHNHDNVKTSAHVNRLLPGFRQQFPLRDLDILGAAIGWQVETNAAPIREAVAMLRDARTEAPSLTRLKRKSLRESICRPLMHFGFQRAPEIFLEAYFTANALAGWEESGGDHVKVMLVYAYEKLGRRDEALEVLDSFGRRQVRMGSEGPWGKANEYFLPADKASELRNQPIKLKTSVAGPIAHSTTPIFSSVDNDTIWFVGANTLHRANLSGATDKKFNLPNKEEQPPTAIAHDASRVYIGTYGGGLISFDKQTESITQFRIDQGLLVDTVTALHHEGSQLWIGYGYGAGRITDFASPGGPGRIGGPGGVGWLIPATKTFGAFIPTISKLVADRNARRGPDSGDPADAAPRKWVSAIASAGTNELWIGALRKGVQRYSKANSQWETFSARDIAQTISAIVADENMVAIACREAISYSVPNGYVPDRGGLSIKTGPGTTFELLSTEQGLPSNDVTALTLDPSALWVGGVDFICRVDRVFIKVSEPITVQGKVEQLSLSPGIIWASIANHLYRIEMPK